MDIETAQGIVEKIAAAAKTLNKLVYKAAEQGVGVNVYVYRDSDGEGFYEHFCISISEPTIDLDYMPPAYWRNVIKNGLKE